MKRSHSCLPAFLLFLFSWGFIPALFAQSVDPQDHRYDLIPYPLSLEPKDGNFIVNPQTTLRIDAPDSLFSNEAAFLRQMIRSSLGNNALKADKKATTNTIILQFDPSLAADESYAASVAPGKTVLKAGTPAGMFYALQTFRQLLPSQVEAGKTGTLSVPAVEISDRPAYSWRGMMLDVSRHFFSVAYLKKFIDLMALYKFNTLHLHLTDDQGWRIEIKKYPRLTSVSGWRTFNDQDSSCMRMAAASGDPDLKIDPAHIRQVNGRTEYGGYYTQAQMKEVIRYATSRHIEIIPEIDMPGHMMAAVALYPWLTCDGTRGADWRQGFSNPICPCKDSSVLFAQDILSEIMDLFPSKYIHIGGDEVEKKDWENSPLCQAFMRDHNIKTLDQLQSYFNEQLQAFFRARGKVLVGWDEIVEGGLDSSAVVMFWRPWARLSPLKAARNGNKVVMTPDGPLYFDAIPDRAALSGVYHYNPADTMYGLSPSQQKNIIGVQANLWSERVPTEGRADYLVMPRMTALAELGWTHKDLYGSYLKRLEGHYSRLDRLGIHYRLPDLPEMADKHVFIDTTSFFTTSPQPSLTIRYTTDGTNPVSSSPVLSRPLAIAHSLPLKLALFTTTGRRGDLYTLSFDQESYAKPVAAGNTVPGLTCFYYKGHFPQTAKIKEKPDSVLQVQAAEAPAGIAAPEFGLKFKGYIDIPETGIYSFFLRSDDGSVLRIADRLVVDNDGFHSSQGKGGQIALEKGLHPFALDFIEGGGGYSLQLEYSRGDGRPQPVPTSWYRHGSSGGLTGSLNN